MEAAARGGSPTSRSGRGGHASGHAKGGPRTVKEVVEQRRGSGPKKGTKSFRDMTKERK
ncbi:MAG: hypothetical protein MZV70_54430 [Desulfobacterales bacterium]|nr:hypothetical protein [Desulfobacterales bacterium]